MLNVELKTILTSYDVFWLSSFVDYFVDDVKSLEPLFVDESVEVVPSHFLVKLVCA